MLVGRASECAAVEGVVEAARDGVARALVLRGEPGIGKSALLGHAIARAEGMEVLRVTGIELEAELEYSGLFDLVRPLLGELEALPEVQAAALRTALGLGAGKPSDRFVVGVATLGLLAAAAERRPVLVVVDDAQWLDRASADALHFAARRLLADRVGVLVAARPEGFEAHGLEELRVTGLDEDGVVALAASVDRQLGADEAAALLAATAGNPLAVLELGRAGIAAGSAPAPVSVTEAIERAFAGKLDALPEETRRALCAAAVAGDAPTRLVDALGELGLTARSLEAAEDGGLIELEGGVLSFTHPLLRSVAYHARPVSERRAAHIALAAALTGPDEVRQRTWHRAAAAIGPYDELADALEAVAHEARARGGLVAALEAYERAARLTTEITVRAARLSAAAQAAWDAGDAGRAGELADEALAAEREPAARGAATGLAGRIEFQAGNLERAHALLLEAAAAFEHAGDRVQAVTMLGVAGLVLHNLARPGDAATLGRRALELAEGEADDVRMRAGYHLGRALKIAGQAEEAEPLLEEVVAHLLDAPEPSRFALQRAAIALAVLDRPHDAMPLARRTLELARATGPMQVVYALSLVAQLEMYVGDWRAAAASATQGLELARDLGQDNIAATFASFLVRMAGSRGDGDELQRWEPEARTEVASSGNRFERLQLDHAVALVALADDRLDDAIAGLAAVAVETEDLGVLDRDLAAEPDLVEALVRQGRRDEAATWLARWVGRGARTARAWAPPLVLRCEALLAEGEAVDAAFAASLAASRDVDDPFALARTRLLHGESLRRRGQRVVARRELTEAVATFERLDAEAWAERGRRELRASGAKLRRAATTGDDLTPQELQIALQVVDGKANKQIAAAMFLSPKTVEFHLSRIYRKLGVRSRTELVRALLPDAARPAPLGLGDVPAGPDS